MPQLTIQQAFDLAFEHYRQGQLVEAEQLYQQIIAHHPDHADSLHHLGLIAVQRGQYHVAVNLIGRALVVHPNNVDALSNLGNAFRDMGAPGQAITLYRRAIALKPSGAEIYCNLGNALRESGNFEEAVASCHKAIALNSSLPEAHNNLGNALRDLGEVDQAIAAYRQALALRPDMAAAQNNLGTALKDKGDFDGAIAAYRKAIELQPNYRNAYGNLGCILMDIGKLDEAVLAYRNGVALKPGYAEGHHDLAQALLMRGDLKEGWFENEWRWKLKGVPHPHDSIPQWSGQPLNGRAILLHAEQGFGDSIQFLRYAPLLAEANAEIHIEVPPELKRISQRAVPGSRVISPGATLPRPDFRCSLLSLPHIFGTTLGSIPDRCPYLYADPALVESWRKTLASTSTDLRVALAWAGSTAFKADHTRSISLDHLAPLAEVRGVTFYCVQKSDAAKQADRPPRGLKLINLAPQLTDFADTAAIMELMDLVVTTDTSVAHLAGALGRPTWVMLQFVPDWRWMLGRDDCPWYPSMRLFRQPHRGDWKSVVADVAKALAIRIESR